MDHAASCASVRFVLHRFGQEETEPLACDCRETDHPGWVRFTVNDEGARVFLSRDGVHWREDTEPVAVTPPMSSITSDEATLIADYFGVDPEAFLDFLHLDHALPE